MSLKLIKFALYIFALKKGKSFYIQLSKGEIYERKSLYILFISLYLEFGNFALLHYYAL